MFCWHNFQRDPNTYNWWKCTKCRKNTEEGLPSFWCYLGLHNWKYWGEHWKKCIDCAAMRKGYVPKVEDK